MIHDEIYNIINRYSYLQIFGIVILYFIVLYFILAPLFLEVCKFLHRKKFLQRIVEQKIPDGQIRQEVLFSLQSILIFGFSGIPFIFLVRNNIIQLLPDTFANTLLGLIILIVWNELHFFTVHRLMHIPFFMKNVHYIHHRSKTPTVYAVYSFHWFEAILLSTVPITIAPVIPLSPLAVFLFPLASVLLNYAGHCNYRFGDGSGPDFLIFGTNHNHHHSRGKKIYGFASHIADKVTKRIGSKF